MSGLDGVDRALVVIAHPDDAEFGAAGTIAGWTAAGVDVRYLVMTDGASGSQDPDMNRKLLAANRHLEQTAACKLLGVTDLEWGGYLDGWLQPSLEARRIVAAAIRRHRPQIVLTLDPEMRITPVAASTIPITGRSATSSCTASTRPRRPGCGTRPCWRRGWSPGTSASCG
ncbi:PIG-L family deacetylase [Euzebya pacifica]|uniref:PIG-L deacetylase family protein n=1 Tax=Euzebya pacifica TaxID=1608957 RepID=UPI0030F62FB9